MTCHSTNSFGIPISIVLDFSSIAITPHLFKNHKIALWSWWSERYCNTCDHNDVYVCICSGLNVCLVSNNILQLREDKTFKVYIISIIYTDLPPQFQWTDCIKKYSFCCVWYYYSYRYQSHVQAKTPILCYHLVCGFCIKSLDFR